MQSTIQIGQLNLRIRGDNPETGHRVAKGIAQSLARKIAAGMRDDLGALSLRVQAPAGASEAEISEAIAERIMNAMRRP